MPAGSTSGPMAEIERLRREYESSLSWRLTRPVRAAGRIGRAMRQTADDDTAPEPLGEHRVDSWLAHYHGERLAALDAECQSGASFAAFRDLDDAVWSLLLTQQYERYPHIRALLPDMPAPELQELWNGRSGIALAEQSAAFYLALRAAHARHGATALPEARVLDFGCGWGRLTRYLARDVQPGRLCGCDPVAGILDVCRASRVPATLALSDFRPERLPFDEPFDLAFAFSVFTHLSEPAHEHCLRALHGALRPGATLVVTVRPPAYLHYCELMHPHAAALGADPLAALQAPRYLFAAHAADPSHPQRGGASEIDYGETVITLAYMRERWSEWFQLLRVGLLLDDPYQVVVTLRRS